MEGAKITLVGLGLMGSALGAALAKTDGITLTIYNRTAAKSKSFEDKGIPVASNAVEAVEASDLIILCISDYMASKDFLTGEVLQALQGRTLLQLSNGSTTEVRELASTMSAAGCKYLDGCIFCYPKEVGTAACRIAIAGPQELYAEHEAVVKSIAPLTMWVGPDYAAATAMNLAAISFITSAYAGYIQGAALAEACGVPMPAITAVCTGLFPVFENAFKSAERSVSENEYDPAVLQTARVSNWRHELHILRNSCEAAKVDTSYAKSMEALFSKGHPQEDMATLYKTFTQKGV